jgi:hypothetical protein
MPSIRIQGATDTLKIGTVQTYPAGGTINDSEALVLPVYFRDASGTALDSQGATGIKIFQFRFTFDPSSVAGCASGNFPNCRVSFAPAGTLAGVTGQGELYKATDSLTVRYELADPAAFDMDTSSADGNLIGLLTIWIPQTFKDGDSIPLTFDRTTSETYISDGASTSPVIETAGNGLELVDGAIQISAAAATCTEITAGSTTLSWTGPASGCSSFSPTIACKANEEIEFRLEPLAGTFSGCQYVRWSFGDGGHDVGTPVRHAYATSGNYTVNSAAIATTSLSSNTYDFAAPIGVAAGGTCTGCSATVPPSAPAATQVAFAGKSFCGSATYRWDFGDGTSAETPNASHTYPSPGTYPWTFTVVANGITCTQSGTISIVSPVHRRIAR